METKESFACRFGSLQAVALIICNAPLIPSRIGVATAITSIKIAGSIVSAMITKSITHIIQITSAMAFTIMAKHIPIRHGISTTISTIILAFSIIERIITTTIC